VPLSAIRQFVRRIAARFRPDKIILFGSYAYGTPHEESDVDLMVVMPARNVIDLALRIDLAFDAPFSVDLHVRTPKQIARGLKEGDCDWLLREVMEKGRVLYEAPGSAVGAQGRTGYDRRARLGARSRRIRGTGARGKRRPAENTRGHAVFCEKSCLTLCAQRNGAMLGSCLNGTQVGQIFPKKQ
jgi:predicted nucleotidyltransferase